MVQMVRTMIPNTWTPSRSRPRRPGPFGPPSHLPSCPVCTSVSVLVLSLWSVLFYLVIRPGRLLVLVLVLVFVLVHVLVLAVLGF
jgi:hypothetical protein